MGTRFPVLTAATELLGTQISLVAMLKQDGGALETQPARLQFQFGVELRAGLGHKAASTR